LRGELVDIGDAVFPSAREAYWMAPRIGSSHKHSWQAVILAILLVCVFMVFLHGCGDIAPWNWCDDDTKVIYINNCNNNVNNNFNNNFNNNNT
jgi:hypothetical protein